MTFSYAIPTKSPNSHALNIQVEAKECIVDVLKTENDREERWMSKLVDAYIYSKRMDD
jgi:hypothetical protein